MVIGILAAVGAGACFASAGVLQQRVAASRPRDESLSFRLILDLARQRLWVAGIGLAVVSYVLQAFALSSAPLAVVQPVLVTEVIFAIPISVRMHHLRLHTREWLGVLFVAGGLAVAIVAAHPHPGNPLVPITSWAPVLAIVAGLTVAAVVGGRYAGPGVVRPASYALAAALVMSLEAALMSATTRRFEGGVVAGFTSWEPYAMAVCSISGLLLIQSAFQAGPLATSMPVTDGVQPIASIGIGLALFHERVATSPPRLAIALAALATLFTGVALLDTSPIVHRVHDQERREAKQEEKSRDAAEPCGSAA